MASILSYVKQEQRKFAEKSFCPVDSLVFSSLAYLNFDCAGVVVQDDREPVLLHDVIALSPWTDLMSGTWLKDSDLTDDFLMACAASRRLREVKVVFYRNELSDVIDKQFSAVTFLIPLERDSILLYVSYRGTDGTVTGWKEDFDLSFKQSTAGQISARRYLSGVALAFNGKIIVGGHSKGGNFAEFAALTSHESVYSRIVSVFDHDGPAFIDNPSPRIGEDEYLVKLHKTVPVSSVIGLLLEDRACYKIVASDAPPFASHSPFMWEISDADFRYEDQLLPGSIVFDRSIKDWLENVDVQQRELVIETVFDLIRSTNAVTWSEFQSNLPQNLSTVVRSGKNLDEETRQIIFDLAKQIARSFTSSASQSLPWTGGGLHAQRSDSLR